MSSWDVSEKFWQRFNGALSFGVIYSKGNQSTQYTFGSQTEYLRERWSAQATLNSNLSSSSGTSPSTRNVLDLSGLHLLRNNGLGSFLQSSAQGINLQTTLGGGVGRFLKNTDRSKLSLFGGVGWLRTNYQQSVVPVGSAGLIWVHGAATPGLYHLSYCSVAVAGSTCSTAKLLFTCCWVRLLRMSAASR